MQIFEDTFETLKRWYISAFSVSMTAPLTHLFPMHRKVFWCFQGIEKGCIGNEWVINFVIFLAHFFPLITFYTPWKHQKTRDISIWDHWNTVYMHIYAKTYTQFFLIVGNWCHTYTQPRILSNYNVTIT